MNLEFSNIVVKFVKNQSIAKIKKKVVFFGIRKLVQDKIFFYLGLKMNTQLEVFKIKAFINTSKKFLVRLFTLMF